MTDIRIRQLKVELHPKPDWWLFLIAFFGAGLIGLIAGSVPS